MKKNYLLASVLGMMLATTPLSADVIGMHTDAVVGDKISIALNESVKATLTWGDGSSEQLTFTGDELEITVKHADFTLKSEQNITLLYCPGCSLSSLKVNEAPNLQTLVCADNKLASLDVKSNPKLVELNCAGNQLENVALYNCRALNWVNVSNNKLETLSLGSLPQLKTLMCANNKLTNLSMTASRDLETLWCQGNSIKYLSFFSSARPVQICAFNNILASLKTDNLSEIHEIWVDNNNLQTLDLSAAHVEVLSASNNALRTIELNAADRNANLMRAFYADGNQLMINSFPTVYNASSKKEQFAYNVSNQKPYVLTESVNINEQLDINDIVRANAWGLTTRAEVVWKTADGKELVKNEDYKTLANKVTFYKPFASVYGEVTSDYYPNEVFRFANFRVVDPTGINDVVNTEDNIQLVVTSNGIQVSAAQDTQITVYNVSGATVVNEFVAAGTYHWTLPAGIYVVNGKKVVIGR